MNRSLFAALFALLLTPVSAQASTVAPQEIVCPVGGERFEHMSLASYSTWGARPDGKPYGSARFPVTPPICPGNGLVIYKAFEADDLAKLPALLEEAAYKALAGDTPFFRAAWLAGRLGSPSDRAWLLLRATWEADDEQRVRYLEAFVEAAEAQLSAPQQDGLTLQLRLANALRELGRFDEASLRLPSGASLDDADRNEPGVKGFTQMLSAAIARRDPSSEPLDLIPRMIAARYCIGGPRTPPRADPLCTQEPLASAVATARAADSRQ